MPKDLSSFYTRESIRIVSCSQDGDPAIEDLQLEYLNKDDRLRIQAEAIRGILTGPFRMKPYPPALGKPELALWGNAQQCVIARKHPQGGYAPLADPELLAVIEDLSEHRSLFFT